MPYYWQVDRMLEKTSKYFKLCCHTDILIGSTIIQRKIPYAAQ